MEVSADHLAITGGNFYRTSSGNIQIVAHNHSEPHSRGFELLLRNVATTALHNSGQASDIPKCHPGTRVAVLEGLVEWSIATTYRFPVKWLHGPAGAGKTAIVRTLAELLTDRGLLLASFFCFRTDTMRNSIQYFISTIAYQICLAIPATRPYIEQAVDANPLLFSLSILDQIQALVVAPLNHAAHRQGFDTRFLPQVLLIDGLDECQGEDKQCEILQILCATLGQLSIPIAIVIASRPEHYIRAAFDLGNLNKASSRVALDDSFHPDEDIRRFYLDKFHEIRSNHPLRFYLPATWPQPHVVEELVLKASGQFIYASTVIKFISPTRHNPATRLDIILGVLDRGELKPFEQLDLLYSTIFHNLNSQDLPRALRFLGIILTPPWSDESLGQPPRSPAFLERFFGLERGEIRRLMLDLESLLTVIDDEMDVHIFHTSLSDFIFDQSRSGPFFVNKSSVYCDLAIQCINQMHQCYDPDLTIYVIHNFGRYIGKADPSAELHIAIHQCDLNYISTLHAESQYAYGLRRIIPMFVEAIRSSIFPDAIALHESHRVKLSRIIEARLEIYRDDRALLYVLLASLSRGPMDPVMLPGFLHNSGVSLSTKMVLKDKEEGLHLLVKYPTIYQQSIFPLANRIVTYVWASMQEQNKALLVGERYADFAIDLLECMDTASNHFREPKLSFTDEDGRATSFWPVMNILLPEVLDRARVRSGLTQRLAIDEQHRFDRKYLTDHVRSSFARYRQLKRSVEEENQRLSEQGRLAEEEATKLREVTKRKEERQEAGRKGGTGWLNGVQEMEPRRELRGVEEEQRSQQPAAREGKGSEGQLVVTVQEQDVNGNSFAIPFQVSPRRWVEPFAVFIVLTAWWMLCCKC